VAASETRRLFPLFTVVAKILLLLLLEISVEVTASVKIVNLQYWPVRPTLRTALNSWRCLSHRERNLQRCTCNLRHSVPGESKLADIGG